MIESRLIDLKNTINPVSNTLVRLSYSWISCNDGDEVEKPRANLCWRSKGGLLINFKVVRPRDLVLKKSILAAQEYQKIRGNSYTTFNIKAPF